VCVCVCVCSDTCSHSPKDLDTPKLKSCIKISKNRKLSTSLEFTVFWIVPCSVVLANKRSRGPSCLHLQRWNAWWT